ncbi:MAG TPA: hypothetical protein VN699_09120 [Pirellulales bacterium]|nr:hypothetical protein [Pirellulales bacterium]
MARPIFLRRLSIVIFTDPTRVANHFERRTPGGKTALEDTARAAGLQAKPRAPSRGGHKKAFVV